MGERYGVSHSLIAKYAQQHNCLGRRKKARQQVTQKADEQLIEMRADALAVQKLDILRCVDRFLISFETALKDDRVRCDNPADFNVMVRLRAFLEGDADSRSELIAGLTMDQLEQSHKELPESLKDSTPAMRGEVVKLPIAAGDSDRSKDNTEQR